MSQSLKQLYEESMSSQIKVWDDEIEHLDSQADLLVAQIEDKYYTLIKRLRQDEKDLKAQLVTLRKTDEGDERLEAIKVQLTCAADHLIFDIKRTIEEIATRNV